MTTLQVARRIFGFSDARARPHGLERAFLTGPAARAWIDKQEALERDRPDVNPFLFSPDLDAVTSMPEEVLHDWLIDHDYPPHRLDGVLGWEDWWSAHAEGFTREQRDRLWRVLDRVTFFALHEVPWDEPNALPKKVWVSYLESPFELREAFVLVTRDIAHRLTASQLQRALVPLERR